MKKIKIFLDNSVLYNRLIYFRNKYLVNDKNFVEKSYKKKTGRKLNIIKPVTYNEKIQWLKLYWHNEQASLFANKIYLNSMIENKYGSSYINHIYGIYSKFDEIDFNNLPESFVIKTNHGSGYNIIVKNKKEMDIKKIKKTINYWMSVNYFYQNREWVYKNIEKKIFIEEYIETNDEFGLLDYRVFCFNGTPRLITVDFNINDKSKTKRDIYSIEWKKLDERITYPNSTYILKKPILLNQMLKISSELTSMFPHARVDFYVLQNSIRIGEVTFFHQSGYGKFFNDSFEVELGNMIEIE